MRRGRPFPGPWLQPQRKQGENRGIIIGNYWRRRASRCPLRLSQISPPRGLRFQICARWSEPAAAGSVASPVPSSPGLERGYPAWLTGGITPVSARRSFHRWRACLPVANPIARIKAMKRNKSITPAMMPEGVMASGPSASNAVSLVWG